MESRMPAPDSTHVLLPAHQHGSATPDMTLLFFCQLAEVVSPRSLMGRGTGMQTSLCHPRLLLHR